MSEESCSSASAGDVLPPLRIVGRILRALIGGVQLYFVYILLSSLSILAQDSVPNDIGYGFGIIAGF